MPQRSSHSAEQSIAGVANQRVAESVFLLIRQPAARLHLNQLGICEHCPDVSKGLFFRDPENRSDAALPKALSENRRRSYGPTRSRFHFSDARLHRIASTVCG